VSGILLNMKKVIALTLCALVAMSSCKKEQSSETPAMGTMATLKVPVGFTWENSTDVYLDINVTDSRFGSGLHVVTVYDADPLKSYL
jgi:hypothetical protein